MKSRQGPLNIYTKDRTWSLLKFAAASPLEIDWELAIRARGVGLDYMCVLWSLTMYVPSNPSRIRIHTSIKRAANM